MILMLSLKKTHKEDQKVPQYPVESQTNLSSANWIRRVQGHSSSVRPVLEMYELQVNLKTNALIIT